MDKNLEIDFFNRLGVKVDFKIIDELVMSDNNILRPVLGHAFEFKVEEIIVKSLLGSVLPQGGDTDVDLIIFDREKKKYTAQIKTLNKASIKPGVSFGVNLHKTHGMEKRPNNLFPMRWPCPICSHEGEEFPDFLIIPHPIKGILIIPKNSIPENKSFPGHYADPAIFSWDSIWINRWDLLGFPDFRGSHLERDKVNKQEKLTKVCEAINLTEDEVLSLWLKPENFRMIDMNLRGNLREPALRNKLINLGCNVSNPVGKYPKYDLIVNDYKVQIKGFSKGLADVNNCLYGVEVMGTHGNGQVRRYSESDFDFLAVVIEPSYMNDKFGIDKENYHFFFVPSKDLPLHYRNGFEWTTKDKLYDVAKFKIIKKDNYIEIEPNNSYANPPKFNSGESIVTRQVVKFRNSKTYLLNSINLLVR
jgi:hypothetical protein